MKKRTTFLKRKKKILKCNVSLFFEKDNPGASDLLALQKLSFFLFNATILRKEPQILQ